MNPVDQGILNKEMFRLMKQYGSMELSLTPFEWVTVMGLLQLGMRHPSLGKESDGYAIAHRAGAQIQAMMAQASEPVGQMIEMGWHEKYDAPSVRPSGMKPKPDIELLAVDAVLEEVQGFVSGVITLDGDGDAILDVSYRPPVDREDVRWRYEMLMYGIGDEFYICHVFWSMPFALREVYRICLGLLENMESIDPNDCDWLED
ncbi:MAG: hypothetical protein IAF02_16520 [Anaerolineae bacterium]|nr:hypothetical protein [Anaerolineae bacterium]